jgi:hypothetical protein
MARTTQVVEEVAEVEEFPDDFEIDREGPGPSVQPVDDGFEQDLDTGGVTTTQNFMGVDASPKNGVLDLGVTVVENDESRRVTVTEDIGPVHYGPPGPDSEIHLLKGRTYVVAPHIYEYLHRRGKIVGQ